LGDFESICTTSALRRKVSPRQTLPRNLLYPPCIRATWLPLVQPFFLPFAMASPILNFSIPSLKELLGENGNKIAITTALAATLIFAYISYATSERPYPGFPMVGRPRSEKTNWPAKMRWLHGAKDLVFNTLYKVTLQ